MLVRVSGEIDMTPTRSDTGTHTLRARYLAGDVASANPLFARHLGPLLAAARGHRLARALATSHSAEDLVGEALARALATGFVERFDVKGPGELLAGLRKVLDDAIVDVWRREQAKKRGGDMRRHALEAGDLPAAEGGLPPAEPSPTSQARIHELLALCKRILTEREWDIWRLADVEGLAPKEIAARKGEPSGTVRGVLSRARARLITVLKDDPTDAPP